MYAVGIKDGRMQMGNDGLQFVHSRTLRAVMRETEAIRKVNDEVYIILNFSQRMSEMDMDKLVELIRDKGVKIK